VVDTNIMRNNSLRNRLRALFVAETQNTYIQLFRYLWVGGVAFVVDIGILALLTEIFSVHYLVSGAIAFLFGLSTNFIISVFWVFPQSSVSSRFAEFTVFAAVGIVGLLLNEAIMWTFTDLLHFHYIFSKVVSTIIVFLWNFTARKFLLYRASSSEAGESL
jgi:putative flippase GtrA